MLQRFYIFMTEYVSVEMSALSFISKTMKTIIQQSGKKRKWNEMKGKEKKKNLTSLFVPTGLLKEQLSLAILLSPIQFPIIEESTWPATPPTTHNLGKYPHRLETRPGNTSDNKIGQFLRGLGTLRVVL